jgi:TonB family protein
MKPLIVVLSLTILAACTSTEELTDLTLPELIVQYPLPAYPYPISSAYIRIEFKILVNDDGTVKFVELLSGSGSSDWDAATIETIKQWRYTPALYKNKPMKLWLKQTAIVQFSEPQFMPLQEIVLQTKEEADSVYVMLKNGYRFEEMVVLHSIAASRVQEGMLGKVNIQVYPVHIKQALTALSDNQFTQPLKFGERYIIFKKVPHDRSMLIP